MNIEQYCLFVVVRKLKNGLTASKYSFRPFLGWRRVSNFYMKYPCNLTCNPLTVRAAHTEMPVCIDEVAILENRVKSSKTRIVFTFWKRPL